MFTIKKIKPLFNGVITTANKYVGNQYADKGSLIIDTRKLAGTMNPYQRVVAVGSTARDIKEGDIVRINFDRYTVAKHVPGKIEDEMGGGKVMRDKYSADVMIPFVEMEGTQYLFLHDSDIEYIVEDYSVDEGGLLE